MKDLFIFAGEKSGDHLGARLIKSLKGEFSFWGVGGEKMRSQGLDPILYTEAFEAMGLSDTIASLPRTIKQFYQVQNAILTQKPTAVVLIDYPGFNLRLAKSLRKKGYSGKIVQYVSPTVWAWGKNRIDTMVQSLDLLMTIFPFEAACFKDTSLKVQFVGNPLVDAVKNTHYDDEWYKLFGIKDPDEMIALFPGSRKGEVELNLPLQIRAAELYQKRFPNARFALSCAHEEIMPIIHATLQESSLKLNNDLFLVPKSYSYELMRDCKSAIAKSGSVTLELALHQKPTVVIYQLSFLNQLFAKYILKLKLKHYCIVNILNGTTVFPELIDAKVTPEMISAELERFAEEGPDRNECIEMCKKTLDLLNTNSESAPSSLIKELVK